MSWLKKAQSTIDDLSTSLSGILYSFKNPLEADLKRDNSYKGTEETRIKYYNKAIPIVYSFSQENGLQWTFTRCELLAYDIIDLIIYYLNHANKIKDKLFADIHHIIKEEIKKY